MFVIASFFCSSFTQTDDVSRSDFGVFGQNLFHVSEKKRPIYLWTILIFFNKISLKLFYCFSFEIHFCRFKRNSSQLPINHFFCMKFPKKCCHEYHRDSFCAQLSAISVFHSCFSYFPFFMFLFFSYLSLAQCMYFQKDSFAIGWNVQHEIYFILWAM